MRFRMLIFAALGLADPRPERRWQAAWRTSLAGALLTAFVPFAWVGGVVLIALAIVGGLLLDRAVWLSASRIGPLLVPVAAVPLLLLPWTVGILAHPGAWLVEAGRAGALPVRPGMAAILGGRVGHLGSAPAWWGWGISLAGLLALLRGSTRRHVLRAWLVVALAAVLLAVLVRVGVTLPGTGTFTPYPGFVVVVLTGALICAAVIASDGLWSATVRQPLGWRQPAAVLGALALLAPVVAGLAWWVVQGVPQPLERRGATGVPSYMTELAAQNDASGVLVLEGGARAGVSYDLLRSGPLRTGDDAIEALTPPDPALGHTVGSLLASGTAEGARRLAAYGVAYVFAPSPVSGVVSGALDASPGFSRASADRITDAAWRVQDRGSLSAMSTDTQSGRLLLIALEVVLGLVLIVLAVPGRSRR